MRWELKNSTYIEKRRARHSGHQRNASRPRHGQSIIIITRIITLKLAPTAAIAITAIFRY